MVQGHEDEVSSVGSSLASYFSVFHRLLAVKLKAVLSLLSAESNASGLSTTASSAISSQLHSISKDLADSCVQSQHTYIHAQVGYNHASKIQLKCVYGGGWWWVVALHL